VDSGFRHAFPEQRIWLAMFLTVPIAMALAQPVSGANPQRGAALPYGTVIRMSAERGHSGVMRGLAHPDQGSRRSSTIVVFQASTKHFWRLRTALPRIGSWTTGTVGLPDGAVPGSMQNIPPDLYESARLDGANRWQEFRDVTLPGIDPRFVFMILMTTIWSFLTFSTTSGYSLQGGPAGASE
jgi:raffinose/stachyose/melibiose transport system permease protein